MFYSPKFAPHDMQMYTYHNNNTPKICNTYEHVLLHYDISKISEISQITKYICNTCPPSLYVMYSNA